MSNDNPSPETRFSAENQPANRGRKKSILNHLAELTGESYKLELTKADKYRIIESLIEKSEEELDEVTKDKTKPMFVRMVAEAVKDQAGKCSVILLETIFDRIYGRPTQDVKTTIGGEIDFIVKYDKPRDPEGN